MTGPALPVNVDTTYANDSSHGDVMLHQQHHDLIHGIVNKVDKDATPTDNQALVFSSGTSLYLPKRVNYGPWAATVYRSGATYYALDFAGVSISSGTNATTVIQAAIDQIAATADETGGGTVFLSAAVYVLPTFPIIRSGVTLRGEGHSGRQGDAFATNARFLGTVLKAGAAGMACVLSDSATAGVVDTSTFANRGIGASIVDIGIDGDFNGVGANQAVIGLRTTSGGFTASGLWVGHCLTYGVRHDDNATFSLGPNFDIEVIGDCPTGFYSDVTDGNLHIKRVLACGTTGIDIRAGGWQCTGGHITGSATGIATRSQYGNQFDDWEFDTCGTHVAIGGSYGYTILNNLKSYHPSTSPPVACINISSSVAGHVVINGHLVRNAGGARQWTNYIRFDNTKHTLDLAGVSVDTALVTGKYITNAGAVTEFAQTNTPLTGMVTPVVLFT